MLFFCRMGLPFVLRPVNKQTTKQGGGGGSKQDTEVPPPPVTSTNLPVSETDPKSPPPLTTRGARIKVAPKPQPSDSEAIGTIC